MKRTSFALLALMMVATVIAACGPAAATATPVAPAVGAATEVPTTAPQATTAITPTTAIAPTTAVTTTTPVSPTTPSTSTTGTAAAKCPLSNLEQGATIKFSGWGDQTEQQVYRDSITRFQAACPGVTVNYEPIPSDFQTKMKAAMAGGTAPDVFYVDDQLMTAFAPNSQLLALDQYMQEAGISRNDFIQATLTIFTLNDKTYALPKDWGTLGLIYLPAAFTDAGIPMPTDNWTWDDMRTAAKAIAAKGKYKGFCQAPDWARFAPEVFSNGGNFTTPDFKTATLDTPQIKQMATFVQGMYKEGSLVQPSDVGASWCGEAIGKQLVAMTTEGGWMVNFMRTTYPDVQWKSALIPKGSVNRADVLFTNGLGVNASTKYPRAAAAFALFVTGTSNQAAIQQTGFAYSTHPEQIKDVVNPEDKVIAQGGLLPDSKTAYWGPYTGKLETAISNALSRIYLGAQTVDEAFAQAQTEGQAALNGQ